jgi:hypothetical protein
MIQTRKTSTTTAATAAPAGALVEERPSGLRDQADGWSGVTNEYYSKCAKGVEAQKKLSKRWGPPAQ